MSRTEMNRLEMTLDEQTKVIQNLIESYRSLVNQEAKARKNDNQKHLAACLAGQQRVLGKIDQLMPAKSQGQSQKRTSAPQPAIAKAVTSQSSNEVSGGVDDSKQDFSSPAGPKAEILMASPFGFGFNPLGLSTHSRALC